MGRHLDVRYIYEEAMVQPVATVEVSADAVAALPLELRKKLQIAAASLSEDEYAPVLELVREIDSNLADGLAALARDFQFDQVLKLLDDARNRSG